MRGAGADGLVVAKKSGNADGAKEPKHSLMMALVVLK